MGTSIGTTIKDIGRRSIRSAPDSNREISYTLDNMLITLSGGALWAKGLSLDASLRSA
jgi:hypothetical protein